MSKIVVSAEKDVQPFFSFEHFPRVLFQHLKKEDGHVIAVYGPL